MKKYTLTDISRITGYSKTTISRVLSGKFEEYRISVPTRDHILQVVKELNYEPNVVAQTLRNNVSKTIGLLLPHIDNPFFANIASIVIREAQHFNYTVMLIDTLEDPRLEEKAIDSLLARNVDGILLVPCGDNPSRLEETMQKKPLLLIDRYFEGSDLPYVSTNNYEGAYQATKLLIESGHERTLCIQGPEASITSKERVRGYREAIRNMGNPGCSMVRGNDFSIQNGYIETKLALAQDTPPTAIFALSNTILLGAMKALNEHQIVIPEDISILSFDDNLYLDYLNPPVSRVVQPLESMGVMAVKMLMEEITGNVRLQSKILLKPNIIKKDSVKIFDYSLK